MYTKIFITRGEILKNITNCEILLFYLFIFYARKLRMKDLLDIEIHPKNYQKGKYDLIFAMTVDRLFIYFIL